jgi:anthranilate phosphoribosyltransferase
MNPAMATLSQLTSELAAGRRPDRHAAAEAARLLADPALPDDDKAAYLSALADLGEDADIVAAFAETYRAMARPVDLGDAPARGIDLVGTGGDRSGSFNISSASALVVAAAGVPVLKHGNRSITSSSGSADFLAGLGVDLEADDARLRRALGEANFCFLFAPAFHPAFRAVGAARKRLAEAGRKSVFNLLGPLVNPARPAHMMVGVFAERWVEPVAGALGSLGVRRGLAVHGKVGEGMDELTVAGPSRVRGAGGLAQVDATWLPGDFGLATCAPADLAGGSPAHNLSLLADLLVGAAPEGLLDTVCLSAGTALWVAGAAADPGQGAARAREVILGGELRDNLRALREAYRT